MASDLLKYIFWSRAAGVVVTSATIRSLNSFKQLSLEKADAIVCLLSDQENYNVSKILYDSYGTKDIIVRYNGEREIYDKLVELGVRIIDPSLAMINLLDHFVRSPNATSILLGLY